MEAHLRRLANLHGELAREHQNLADQLASLALAEPACGRADAPAAMDPTASNPNQGEPLLDVAAVARRLGISPRTARRWRCEGRLPPAVVVGGIVRWDPRVIDAWLAAHREGAA